MTPLRIEPSFGKRSENAIQSPSKERWDVLSEDVAGSHSHSGVEHREPKPAALAVEPFAVAGDREVLAGESSDDELSANHVGDGCDVAPDRSLRKIPARHRFSQ
jgi:hypothetical protein